MPCPRTVLSYAQIVDDVHAEYFAHLSSVPGLEVHCDPDVTWKVSPAAAWDNCAFRMRFPDGAAARRIDTILERYRKNQRGAGFWVGAAAQPTDLTDLLKARGLRCRKYYPAMHCDLSQPLPSVQCKLSVDVQVVTDYDQFRTKPHPAIGLPTTPRRRFSLNARRHLASLADRRTWEIVAMDGERPIGVCTVFLGQRYAGLYDVAVLESHRNLGVGRTLVREACALAQDRRSKGIILIATNIGYRVYQHVGFHEVCRFGFWYAAHP